MIKLLICISDQLYDICVKMNEISLSYQLRIPTLFSHLAYKLIWAFKMIL